MIQMSRSAGNADLHDTRNFQALTLVPVEVTLFKMKIKKWTLNSLKKILYIQIIYMI